MCKLLDGSGQNRVLHETFQVRKAHLVARTNTVSCDLFQLSNDVLYDFVSEIQEFEGSKQLHRGTA